MTRQHCGCPERVPCEARSSRDSGSNATSLPSAAASSASEAASDSTIEEHPIRLPRRLLHRLVPLVSEAELRGAAQCQWALARRLRRTLRLAA